MVFTGVNDNKISGDCSVSHGLREKRGMVARKKTEIEARSKSTERAIIRTIAEMAHVRCNRCPAR